MASLVLSIFAGTATSPPNRPFLPLVPRLLFLASLALVVDEYLMDEIFDLLSLDFLWREVLTMVGVNCVSYGTYLSAKCFLERARPRDRNSESHRVCVFPDFDIVEETLSVRSEVILNYNRFVSLLQSDCVGL